MQVDKFKVTKENVRLRKLCFFKKVSLVTKSERESIAMAKENVKKKIYIYIYIYMVMHVLMCICHNQDKEEEKQIRSGKGRKLEEKFLKLAGIPEISRNLSQARITKGLPVLVSISVQEFPDLTTLHLRSEDTRLNSSHVD